MIACFLPIEEEGEEEVKEEINGPASEADGTLPTNPIEEEGEEEVKEEIKGPASEADGTLPTNPVTTSWPASPAASRGCEVPAIGVRHMSMCIHDI